VGGNPISVETLFLLLELDFSQELAKVKFFILFWKIYRTVRDFYSMGRKISRCAGTCPGHVLGKKRNGENYTFLNFNIENENLKILNPSPDG
jgi:hypothetical protein